MKTLVIDVGGTHVKLLATGRRTPTKLESGPNLTARQMVRAVKQATADWQYDRISIGYPGPVRHNKPQRNPWNLGGGWAGFDFKKAFGKPVQVINDAAMQALGSYEGGVMLFLGLGTGLGTTMVRDGVVIPLEMGHLPYRGNRSYEDVIGDAGYQRLGKKAWRKEVERIIELFTEALLVDYVVLGGGNVRHMKTLPKNVRAGTNLNAFKGGFRLWD